MASAPMFGLAQFGPQFFQLPPPSALRQTFSHPPPPPGPAPAPARRGAGPQPPGIGWMRDQRGHPPGDVEWAEALPVRQLRSRRGCFAPPPEVFQFGGMDVMKRLRPALREPRAVGL